MTRHNVRVLLLLTVGALLHSVALAGVCPPPTVQKESPYHYLLSLTDALSHAKSGLDRTSPAGLGSRATDFDLLFGLKLGKGDFECAKAQVSPYVTSSNEAIKTSAQGAALVFSLLVDLQDKSVAEHKAFLDAAAEGKVKPGTTLERHAELAASYDEAWKLLITAVIASTYAVVEVEPATGLMSRLGLTRVQRDEVLKKVHSTFGDEVKRGMKAGQLPLVAAAAALYQVLGDPERKLRDSR
jgi:hypothetical protein